MPIDVSDIKSTNNNVNTYDAKWFSNKLTGRGGNSAGYLSEKNGPSMIDADVVTRYYDTQTEYKSYKTGNTKIDHIPLTPLTRNGVENLGTIPMPDKSKMVKIADYSNPYHTMSMYMEMKPWVANISDTTVYDKYGLHPTTKHEFTLSYICAFYIEYDANVQTYHYVGSACAPVQVDKNVWWVNYTSNPKQELGVEGMGELEQVGWTVYRDDLSHYFENYDIYNAVCERSNEWQTSIARIIDYLFTSMSSKQMFNAFGVAEEEVKYIMTYNIPLDLYKPIFASIQANFNTDNADEICKQNLNLLLSDTLNHLDSNKSKINGFTAPTNNQLPADVQKLSPEQVRAVKSTEPLVLVQAGAGTGKSTMLLGRISYMVDAGVEPEDITVLSFTNAAADHITDLNPRVHSMTIASMIHEIYTNNFSNHALSTNETIINTLDIVYNQMNRPAVVDKFKERLQAMVSNDANNFTEMNNFIERNYDEIIDILNTIKQTSLELEIIICYQQIDNFTEPADIASKYLIIDEVQDNSIFEFVYTLKYVDKHSESLFIVGDCAQTLYEFRASNPKALNILENSGTFTCYQLNVNYRSKQEILDFANVALQNIEANQFAQIQLQANNLTPVTEQSFLDCVSLNYHQLARLTDWYDALPGIFSMEVRPYIEKCKARGEQIAILAPTRRDVDKVKGILENQYPTDTIVSLVPKRNRNMTIMTGFIKRYWDNINFAPYGRIMSTIRTEILNRLTYLTYNPKKEEPLVIAMLDEWKASEGNTVDGWVSQVDKGQMSVNELLELVKKNMIDFEINRNAVKQALLARDNQELKDSEGENADFVLSTIHSAKGLEFDNVIVMYKNDNTMDEDKKRMYYVALTRAKNSEYILAYDTKASPNIQADYISVLEHLHGIAPAKDSPIVKLKKGKTRHITV